MQNKFSIPPGFAGLTATESKRLASLATLVTFDKNELIFRAGERSSHAWFLVSGKVTLGSTSEKGNLSAACIVRSGDVFCCIPILDSGPYTVTAICTKKTVVARIPTAEFNEVIAKNPAAYKGLVATFCSKMREVECRLCHQANPASDKISSALWHQYNKFGPEFELTRFEIAQLAGLSVETVIRRLSVMKKKRIIGGKPGVIRILKPAALMAMSGR